MFPFRRELTQMKTCAESYFTMEMTFYLLYIKCNDFIHTIWQYIYVKCILIGKNRLNKNSMPRACCVP